MSIKEYSAKFVSKNIKKCGSKFKKDANKITVRKITCLDHLKSKNQRHFTRLWVKKMR